MRKWILGAAVLAWLGCVFCSNVIAQDPPPDAGVEPIAVAPGGGPGTVGDGGVGLKFVASGV